MRSVSEMRAVLSPSPVLQLIKYYEHITSGVTSNPAIEGHFKTGHRKDAGQE